MRGSLETISVAELCMQLGGQGMSGTLSLESEGHAGQIAFENGAVVWATSPSRGARIGDRLVHAGLLDPYYVDQAAQAQREAPPGTGIAALLVDRGLVSEDAARLFLQEQMLDSLTELLGWRTGSFDLSSNPPPVTRLAVAVPTESLLTEVRRRLAEQERVRTVVTSLELVPAATPHTPQHLAMDESVVLREVDGVRTLADLASDLGFGDNELRRIVYGLATLDAVTLNGAPIEVADDPLDEIEHAIEDSLDEALAGHVSDAASDELESVLEGLLAGAVDEITEPEMADGILAEPEIIEPEIIEPEAVEPEAVEPEAVEPEAVEPQDAVADLAGAPQPGEPAVDDNQIEAARHESSDVDEPRPWVGYAKARPGTSPPPRTPTPPPVPTAADLPYIATPVETSEAAPVARATPPDHRTRTEAASWLAEVSDPDAPTEHAAEPPAPAPEPVAAEEAPPEQPSTEPEPMWTVGATPEPPSEEGGDERGDETADAAESVEDQPEAPAASPEPPSPSRGGDDLSALLAELSSLSTDDDPGDRPAAPPPRKASTPSQDDSKDPKKRRLFGR